MARKKCKLKRGTIYQKKDGGTFYFRFQVNGQRKAVSLQTRNFDEAKRKAEELVSVVSAPSLEVVAAHVAQANFGQKKCTLTLADAWAVYTDHPHRATPATVAEEESYRATWRDFVGFIGGDKLLDEVTPELAKKFADHIRTQPFAVDTHNRKIRRIKKVFATLADYCAGKNPFDSCNLMRSNREERGTVVRRGSFSKEQERELLAALDDPAFNVRDRLELSVLFHLGMFTGQRLKDCALLQWNRVSFPRRRIWVRQFKTGKDVTIPISDQLLTALEHAREWQRNDYVLPSIALRYQAEDSKGKCVGVNQITSDVLRVIRRIGLEPSVKVPGRKRSVTVYGFHSLRHSFASHCAEAGVPKAVAQSILGAASDIIDKYYVHIGEEAQLKAIKAIDLTHAGDRSSAQERIDRTLAMISRMENKSPEIQRIEEILRG